MQCCAHRLNLIVEILSLYHLLSKIEELFSCLYPYFNVRLKKCIELAKLACIMETKDLKMLKAVKTRSISMMSPCKCVLSDYMPLLVKMG
jgi:hypothetical protein